MKSLKLILKKLQHFKKPFVLLNVFILKKSILNFSDSKLNYFNYKSAYQKDKFKIYVNFIIW
jgi:hypothetical protein